MESGVRSSLVREGQIHPRRSRKVPHPDDERLKTYPNVYRYLTYCQETTMWGIKVNLDMPGHRNEGDSINGRERDRLYLSPNQTMVGG